MAWTVYGQPYSTAAMTDTSIYQYFKPQSNLILKALRAWVIQNNDPSYTSINMKIYSNNGGSPRTLIATSTNVQTKAAMFGTSNSGVKEVWFDFDPLVLKEDERVDGISKGSVKTCSDSAHLAWRQMFYEAAYRTNFDDSFEGALSSPLGLIVIGAKL